MLELPVVKESPEVDGKPGKRSSSQEITK